MTDAFHQAAIAQKRIGMVINDVMAVAVKLGGKGFFGNRKTNGIGDTLAEWACGRLNTRGIAILRVTWGF